MSYADPRQREAHAYSSSTTNSNIKDIYVNESQVKFILDYIYVHF